MLKSLLQKFGLKEDQKTTDRKSLSSLAAKVLTDEKEVARVQPYLTAIKNAIDEPAITNIAVTGAYGSGKSTIIKTFQHLNPENKYLNISLASFNDSNNTDDMERLLEVSILQQIFYHVKPDEIPDSRFKRIINNTTGKIWSIAIGLVLWISSIFILFKFDYIKKINPDTWIVGWKNIDWIALLVFLVFFFGIGMFSKTVVRLFSNSKINKLNIQGEVELGDNIDKSVFNEHLEEILYFFERTDYNVIVIEDLDRFESTDIFTKLREINILLNNSKSIQSKRGDEKINFLYAIKDDMFKDKNERVKFFEYIIPIIPFINPSNADEQLSKLIREAKLESVLSQEFISDVITFIDDIDMRLLINIFHEFVLYRDALNPEFITKPEELFAIITYKNLYPNDFMKLHRREGMLYQFINNKNQYIFGIVEKIDQQIKTKEKNIKDIENEYDLSVKELRAVYIRFIQEKIPDAVTLNINGNKKFFELVEDENFEKLLEDEKISYNYYQVYNDYGSYQEYRKYKNTTDISFSKIEQEVNADFTYSEREKFIINKTNDKIQNLKLEIEKLKNRKQEVKSWDVKQIFEEIDISTYLDVFAGSPLMRNLLLNGYLNENYNDYISLFHEVSLTKEDFIFEKKVKSGEVLTFDYNLTNVETIISKIPEKYFKRDTILNFDLLDFLAANYNKYKPLYESIIKVLSNEKQRSIEFIDSYIHRQDFPVEIFMPSICKSWPGLIDYLYNDSNYTEEKENFYLELLIKFVPNEDIVEFQNNDLLKDLIEEKPYFLSMIKNTDKTDYFEKISSLFKNLNVKFSDLDPVTDETKRLFDYVYENDSYQINAENIEAMILEYSAEVKAADLEKAHFNSVLLSKCDHLIGYVKGHTNAYVRNVFLKLEGNSEEPEESFLILLNDLMLEKKLKQDIINKYNFKISTISDIKDEEIKTMLVESNKIVPNWENVIDYYIDWDSSLEKPLIDFLNSEENYLKLSKEKMEKEGDFGYAEFRKNILLCNDLSDESYKKLLENSLYTRDQLAFEHLSNEKVKYLVENILTLSEENYNLLKERFPHLHIDLVAKHQNKFIVDFEKYTLDEKDIILLLGNLSKINHQTKIEIIKLLDSDVIINNKDISVIVCGILSNSSYIPLEYQVLEGLFKNTTSLENRIKLLNIQFSKISIEEISNLVKILPYPYSDIAVRRKRPTIPFNSHNREFINNLNNQGFISSFEVKHNEIKIVANY
ncbi:YobI family P-loop NTPase [Soonwooa purpurea]